MRKLNERRRNPHLNFVNRRADGATQVEQFLGRDDAFVSMGSMSKLGIKPMFGWTTPLGIYAYPLAATDVMDTIRNEGLTGLPFRGASRFAHVILADIPDQQMLSVYTNSAQMEERVHQLAIKEDLGFLWPNIMKQADAKWRKSDTQERIIRSYNASRGLAFYMAVKRKWGLAKMGRLIDNNETITDGEFEEFGAMSIWNALLRKIGYEAMTDEGTGYIHHNEESQTCFFSTKPFQRVITVEVASPDYSRAKEIGSMQHLIRLVRNGLDPRETMHILNAMRLHQATPPGYTDWSYRAGVRPTKGEVNLIVRLLKQTHPDSAIKHWGGFAAPKEMQELHDWVVYGID